MDRATFAQMAAMCGLELTDARLDELFEYSRPLFAALKPRLGQAEAGEGATAEHMKRIFHQTPSVEELDLGQTEPALHFDLQHLFGK